MPVHFILGGARSGKSRLAEQKAKNSQLKVSYIATATAGDSEMSERITQHQNDRPKHWTTIEEPLHLAQQINALNQAEQCLIVDCLTLWLLNLISLNNSDAQQQHIQQFIRALQQTQATVILVSNEVGNGIVPMGKLNRQFVDQSGFLHQQVSQVADTVEFIMAGLPLTLKG